MNLDQEDKIVAQWNCYQVPVKVKKLDPRATIPMYHTDGAVAFDMHAIVDEGQVIRVNPHSQKILSDFYSQIYSFLSYQIVCHLAP